MKKLKVQDRFKNMSSLELLEDTVIHYFKNPNTVGFNDYSDCVYCDYEDNTKRCAIGRLFTEESALYISETEYNEASSVKALFSAFKNDWMQENLKFLYELQLLHDGCFTALHSIDEIGFQKSLAYIIDNHTDAQNPDYEAQRIFEKAKSQKNES